MRTILAHRVALVVALWSVLAGTVLARGASLCIGPDRHVALELPGTDCCETDDPALATAPGLIDRDCADCRDTELTAGGDLTTRRISAAPASAAGPAVLPVAPAAPHAASCAAAVTPRAHVAGTPPPLSLPLRC